MSDKKGNSFLKSISILASGSIIAQIIVIASAPVITRLFSPEDIGFYTYLISLLILFIPIINGRYDMSIIIEKNEKNVFSLIKLSLIISFCASVIITIGIFVFFRIASLNQFYDLYIIITIFFLLLVGGVINVLNAYNNRLKEYKLMSSIYVIRTSAQNIGAVFLGIFNIGLAGLIIPYLVGQFLGIKRQARHLIPHIKSIMHIPIRDALYVVKVHKDQPIYSMPAIFVNNFSYASITFFVGALFGIAQVGFYSISTRILGLPLSVVSGNVSKVFFEAASREYDNTGQYFQTFKKTTLLLAVLSIPLVLIMYFVIPPLTPKIFGEKWGVAGTYIKILSIMFGLRFITSSLTPALHIVMKQKYELILQLLFIVASVGVYFVTKTLNLDIINYFELLSFLFSLIYIVYYFVMLNFSRKRIK